MSAVTMDDGLAAAAALGLPTQCRDEFARIFAGIPTPIALRKCRYCGCTESPDTAPDPYTTDGTVEVCPQCNEGESYIAIVETERQADQRWVDETRALYFARTEKAPA